ncbi:DUF2938 family protein [Xanthobacter autotrophicus DSM 431]|uniref:DUF2938 family protein n=1 Tax=Xanthobacter nonsaccharivorans TaxID=3119912 RepID=UPI00372A06F0
MLALEILVVGLIGTAVLDIWQRIYERIAGLPPSNWGMIGRWVGHFPEGEFTQPDIGKAAPVPNEVPLGWLVHYVVGIGYAAVYLILMRFVFHAPPSLASALLFGALSVSVTWFVMEPVLGAGALASRVPADIRTRVMAQDFTSHLSIGFGIWLGTKVALRLYGM